MAVSIACRMAAICGSDRSTGRLIEVAPRSSSTRAVAGLAAASVTEIFNTKSAGKSPALGIRSVLASGVGQLLVLGRMKSSGYLPADFVLKISVTLAAANPATARRGVPHV